MTDSYIVLDLETTGLQPKKDKIIEIGAVKVINNQIAATYETLVKPGRILSETTVKLTGITDEMLQEAKEPDEAISGFLEFAEEYTLIGHHILFDYAFVKKWTVNHNVAFERNGIDTLKAARKLLPDVESKKLEHLCRYYDIPHHPHRALEDARATHLLYQKLKTDFQECLFLEAKPLKYCVKKEGPMSRQQHERLLKLIQMYRVTVDFDIDTLTRNEASRYADNIIYKYGNTKKENRSTHNNFI